MKLRKTAAIGFRWLALLLAGAGLPACDILGDWGSWRGPGAPGAGGIRAVLRADPPSHNGPAPAHVRFVGQIIADRPCTVRYQHVFSNGDATGIRTLDFAGPGALDTLAMEATHTADARGWVKIRVVSPVAVESPEARFEVRISGGGATPPGGVRATLAVDPPTYRGPAPAHLRLRGQITSDRAGRVTYEYAWSHGGVDGASSIDFSAPGARDVERTADFVGSSRGWVKLRVASPVRVESPEAPYDIQIGPPSPPTPRGIRATLAANPPTYTGPTPVTVYFRGQIIADRACTVTFQFVWHDGNATAPSTRVFSGPGAQNIEMGALFRSDARGWAKVRVLSPEAVESAQATFEVHIR